MNTKIERRKKLLTRWLKIIVLLYCVIGIAIYYLQDKFMFHPEPVEPNSAYNFKHSFKEVNVPVDDKTNLNVVQFGTADSAKGVVLYFHGNMKNVTHYAGNADKITTAGYELWMPDYPGFGKSTGELTEAAMYAQALQVYKMARAKYQPSQIIIYGRSMGTGVASQLASIRDCKRLILETPYYNLPDVANRFFWMYPLQSMLKFKFPTNEYLDKVTAPVTIFHGTDDQVIPYTYASRLQKELKPGDEFITIKGGSHNDLMNYKEMKDKLRSLLTTEPASTTSL